ncbi:organic solute transport protein 1-domain-containing protein [Dunaliella salina]|uniref:Organic solute transport protein 1-domain-containing protein n=1 Tax=Dunaliella salina TaxID=3046 RepID=A0ABQ7H5R6_DUNSA|nr:organic solute transport protein 1-domain-containing protein [Dunaliella salina]|eukprot:KAF5842192.1 organic solute transport protein 1-domain-containing protein [Dunaliella salina]
MSLKAMPIIITNLGCEMLFILEQRLVAQNISADKSTRVLHDVAKTMFNETYVEKLFAPQELYTVSTVRKIFDQIAHSSIMKLSEPSMDKLFDLMMMGLKYQIMCSNSLGSMLQVTLLHLQQIKATLRTSSDTALSQDLISHVERLLLHHYEGMSMGMQHLLRQTLQRFFQERRVKVSLFLQEGIQTQAGRLILPSPLSTQAGSVTYYNANGGVEAKDKLKLHCQEIDPAEFFIHPVPLGTNLYNKARPKVVPPVRKADEQAKLMIPPGEEMAMAGAKRMQHAEDVVGQVSSSGGRRELDLLSAMMNIKPPSVHSMKLELFQREEAGNEGVTPVSAPQGQVRSYNFDEGSKSAYKEDMLLSLNLEDNPAGADQAGAGDDLLDLMDKAG